MESEVGLISTRFYTISLIFFGHFQQLSFYLVHRENPRPMDVVMNGWLRLP